MRDRYILFRRPDGAEDGKVYYAAFWDQAAGDYKGKRSTSRLKKELLFEIPAQPTSKAGARAIVEEWLKTHSAGAKKGELAIEYLEAFWASDGAYATGKRARDKGLSEQYLYNNRNWIRKYVKPYLEGLGRPLAIERITPAILEGLAMHLYELEISTKTANQVLAAVAKPLAEAERLGRIPTNPARRVERLAEVEYVREPLTVDECRAFFHVEWSDPRLYAANLLAATTGLRLGEVRGLQTEDLRGDYLHVCHNWQDREGSKGPKGSKGSNVKIRDVPLPTATAKVLLEIAKKNPWGDGCVFWGDSAGRPIGKSAVEDNYNAMLRAIGIDDTARKVRGLGFHAWRHWYNSRLRGRPGIPDHALRMLTGHQSEDMTEIYTEITSEQRAAIAELADTLVKVE